MIGETRQERLKKREWLRRFQNDGFSPIDAFKDPFPRGTDDKTKVRSLRHGASALISEVRDIRPGRVLLIKATVYDTLYEPLRQAGLPVVDGRLPFPGSGRQVEFHEGFRDLVNEGKLMEPATPVKNPPSPGMGTVTGTNGIGETLQEFPGQDSPCDHGYNSR